MTKNDKILPAFAAVAAGAMLIGNTGHQDHPAPFSDPENSGGWVYDEAISDEFNGTALDEDRWFIVGKLDENGQPQYVHPDDPGKRVWKGRAPSQFSGENHRLEDGILILETRWEPDFPFSDEIPRPAFGEAMPYANITTPSLIQRREFTYGYMETRAKVADAPVNSAFWSIGNGLEIDIFELFGDGTVPGKEHLATQLWWSLRDWGQLRGRPVYTERRQIPFRPADDFHVYGLEWNEDGAKYYLDGELIADVSVEDVRRFARENNEVGENYDGWAPLRKPIVLWLDMEVFPWHHIPQSLEDLERNSPEGENTDGVVEFEVDYVRLWQRAD